MKEIVMELPEYVLAAYEAAKSRKAQECIIYDVSETSGYTDYVMIAHGNSTRQAVSISDEIQRALVDMKIKPIGSEGRNNGDWILTDFGNLVVHIMLSESRLYYQLDSIWRDNPSFGDEISE
ncbi:MAG: ribosome silencing factor [Deltaproteobacteria bacterium]|nr:ribosome silencing factor [Deltaproteobacteria bacterium]